LEQLKQLQQQTSDMVATKLQVLLLILSTLPAILFFGDCLQLLGEIASFNDCDMLA